MCQKLNVLSLLFHRCETIITEKKKQAEMEKIKKDIRVCGYSEQALRQGNNKEISKREREIEREREHHHGREEVCGHPLLQNVQEIEENVQETWD